MIWNMKFSVNNENQNIRSIQYNNSSALVIHPVAHLDLILLALVPLPTHVQPVVPHV